MKCSVTLLNLALAVCIAGVAQNPPTPAAAMDAANVSLAVPAPTSPGVIRLGLVQPRLEMGAPVASDALRTVLTQYLSGPQIEVVPITAMAPLQVQAEAKQKSCDYLFYASLSQKQARRFGLLQGAQAMTHMVPAIGMAGRAGAIIGHAAATTVSAASQLSSGVTAKSEVMFQYQLLAPGAASPIVADTMKAKAQSDGQDVITPMILQAATTVTDELLKK